MSGRRARKALFQMKREVFGPVFEGAVLECMEILPIASNTGIRVSAIKGILTFDGTIQSRIIAMAFSMVAKILRDLISASHSVGRSRHCPQTYRAIRGRTKTEA